MRSDLLSGKYRPLAKNKVMFRAIGLILLLIAVRILMPMVFSELEDTLVQVTGVAQNVLTKTNYVLNGAVSISSLAPQLAPSF